MSDLDDLVREAGQSHVIRPHEDPALLERVRDPRVLERAAELLESDDSGWRSRAILCIERIAYAKPDQETAELLLRHAESAKDKHEVMTTLTALARCTPPRPLPSEPLLRLARRREWQVWHDAVSCLHLSIPEEVEPALLERLDADKYGLVYVARELRYMKSPESIRALEQLLEHETLDVRGVALDSLGERLAEGVVPYARRFAAGKRREEKWWAEEWLGRYGDAEDIPFMAERVKKLTGGTIRGNYLPPELSLIVPFLKRHADSAEAQKALERIGGRMDRLPAFEREWVEEHAPELLPKRGQ
jgi:HEAT repeat protein